MKDNKVSFYVKGKKYYQGNCDYCGNYYEGVGRYCCSRSCSAKNGWKTGILTGLTGRTRENSSNWKGGKIFRDGYVFLLMKNGKYKGEHRVVMENYLGRNLENFEEVHHKNCIKDDNRLENLEVKIKKAHFGVVRCPHCIKEFLIK